MNPKALQDVFHALWVIVCLWQIVRILFRGWTATLGGLIRILVLAVVGNIVFSHPAAIAEFIRYNQEHTADCLMLVWLLAAVFVINKSCSWFDACDFVGHYKYIAGFGRKRVAQVQEAFFPLSDHDARICAAHEAGHLLLYGVAERIPEGLTAYIGRKGSSESPLRGGVSHSSQHDEIRSAEQQYLDMCRLLAAQVAEEVILAKRFDGSGLDLIMWENMARVYLGNGCQCATGKSVYFFSNPKNDPELKQNMTALTILKESQMDAVREYLEANRGILAAMADRLIAKHELQSEEIANLLAGCVITKKISCCAAMSGHAS